MNTYFNSEAAESWPSVLVLHTVSGCADPPTDSDITGGLGGGTFNCTVSDAAPAPVGSTCSFTCAAGVADPDTFPVCQAGGSWADATAGVPPTCLECLVDDDCDTGLLGTCDVNGVCQPGG